MEEQIINFLIEKSNGIWTYIKITDNNILSLVYNLLINKEDKVEEKVIHQNPLLYYYYGIYYHYIDNRKLLKKYYKTAIENEINEALCPLGDYYDHRSKYEKMKKYHLAAIEHGNIKSMYMLANYYQCQGDYEQMIKYYVMAVEHGDVQSMYQLGLYYQEQKMFELMEIYYLMAVNHGIDNYLYGLHDYYYRRDRIDDLFHYNLMVIEKQNNRDAWNNLARYYQENLVELLNLITFYRDLNRRKGEYSNLIISQIPVTVRHFRFKDQSIGMKIMNYHFKINRGASEVNIYQQLKDKDPIILNYLNITEIQQVADKIKEYYDTYC